MDKIKLNGYEIHKIEIGIGFGIGAYTIQAPENFAANSNTFYFFRKFILIYLL